jgi:hypothetical protein
MLNDSEKLNKSFSSINLQSNDNIQINNERKDSSIEINKFRDENLGCPLLLPHSSQCELRFFFYLIVFLLIIAFSFF